MTVSSNTSLRIVSPISYGNGAHVIHSTLEAFMQNYEVLSYNPYWTLIPFLLPVFMRNKITDIVHTSPDYAIFHRLPEVPLIITFHNYVLDAWMRKYSSTLQKIHYTTALRLFTKLAVKNAAAVTAVSKFTADLVRKDLGCQHPISVIYNGVDEKSFTPLKKKQSGSNINVFFSGNLTQRKGSLWLPKIARRLKGNIKLFYTKGLRARNITYEGDNLQSIGRIPYAEMPKHYREMDILLMPTVREGYGLAVAEAMACALPVVASNCSSIPELIDDKKGGFLCPVGDVDAFAEKINGLAESPKLRAEMGEYNRAKIESKFTLSKMVNKYHVLFEEVYETSVRN